MDWVIWSDVFVGADVASSAHPGGAALVICRAVAGAGGIDGGAAWEQGVVSRLAGQVAQLGITAN